MRRAETVLRRLFVLAVILTCCAASVLCTTFVARLIGLPGPPRDLVAALVLPRSDSRHIAVAAAQRQAAETRELRARIAYLEKSLRKSERRARSYRHLFNAKRRELHRIKRYLGGYLPPARAHAPRTGESLLVYARRFVGVPYVWGGSSPHGFDCSGLTKYCYAAFGVYLPRVVSGQAHYGRWVPYPRPGDLLFFGLHHVAIYAGHGLMLHAPYTGAHVRYNAAIGYSQVRRYLP